MGCDEEWKFFRKELTKDKQKIIVWHEALGRELKRTFYIEFWKKNGRSLWCDEFCNKWKPRYK